MTPIKVVVAVDPKTWGEIHTSMTTSPLVQVAGVVQSGLELLNAVDTHSPDILVLALRLSDGYCFDVLNQLRDQLQTPPKTLILTDTHSQDLLQAVMIAGANQIISKPWSADVILRRGLV